MARGDFLGSFAKGIYSEMNNQQQLQAQKDYQSKQGLIQMLAGLADKVEPQSLPLLMGHIWDTMGIKPQSGGKGLRGFLDAFSGMPNRSVEDQLGSKFRELTQGFVGPQEAQGTRLRNNIAQKGIPGYVPAAPASEYGQKAAADLQNMNANKMVFRDPYQQKLSEIEARYGAQLAAQQQRMEDSHANRIALLQQTHQNDLERDREKYGQFIDRSVNILANTYLTHPEILKYPPEQRMIAARQMARDTLSREEDLKVENAKQNVEVKKATVIEKKANAGKGSPSVQISRQHLGHTVAMDRNKLQEAHDQANGKITNLTSQLEDAGKALDDFASKMSGMTREKLAQSYMAGMGKGPVVLAIQKYNKLKNDLSAAIHERDTRQKQLDDYDKTKGGTQLGTPAAPAAPAGKKKATRPVLPGKNAVGPVTSNPTGGQTVDATDKMPGDWVRAPKMQIESRGQKPGDIINYGPKKYRIGDLRGDWYVLIPVP